MPTLASKGFVTQQNNRNNKRPKLTQVAKLNLNLKKNKAKTLEDIYKNSKYIIICIGTPVNNKQKPELKKFISLFLSILLINIFSNYDKFRK